MSARATRRKLCQREAESCGQPMSDACAGDSDLYYARNYPCETLCALLGRAWSGSSTLQLREVAVETGRGHFIRWLSVGTGAELRGLLRKLRPCKVHSGAIYSVRPHGKDVMHGATPVRRELVFDIDASDYTPLGVQKDDIAACDAAWPVVALGTEVICSILSAQLNFVNIMVVYSGRRGVHISVYDKRACELGNDARSAIVAFMQPRAASTKNEGRVHYGSLTAMPWFARLYDEMVLPFWTGTCLRPKAEGGMGLLDLPLHRQRFVEAFGNAPDLCQRLAAASTSGTQLWAKLVAMSAASKYPDTTRRALTETVLTYVWPRLDAGVSRLMSHLNKTPFSVHPATNRICIPITEPLQFKPSTCPTVSDVVSGDSFAFAAAVKAAEAFARRDSLVHTEAWRPPVYSLLGHKRLRDDTLASAATEPSLVHSGQRHEWMYTDVARYCVHAWRHFLVLARPDDANDVRVLYVTWLQHEGRGESLQRVYAGCAPPHRNTVFPAARFCAYIKNAPRMPGKRRLCHSAYTCILLPPSYRTFDAAADRVEALRLELQGSTSLGNASAAWTDEKIDAYVQTQLLPAWDEAYIHIK